MNQLKFESVHDIPGIKISLTFYNHHRDSIFFLIARMEMWNVLPIAWSLWHM